MTNPQHWSTLNWVTDYPIWSATAWGEPRSVDRQGGVTGKPEQQKNLHSVRPGSTPWTRKNLTVHEWRNASSHCRDDGVAPVKVRSSGSRIGRDFPHWYLVPALIRRARRLRICPRQCATVVTRWTTGLQAYLRERSIEQLAQSDQVCIEDRSRCPAKAHRPLFDQVQGNNDRV